MTPFDPLEFMEEKSTDGWYVDLDQGRKVTAIRFPNTVVLEARRKQRDPETDLAQPQIPFIDNGDICYGMRLSLEAADALYSILGKVLGKTELITAISNWSTANIITGTDPSTVNIKWVKEVDPSSEAIG